MEIDKAMGKTCGKCWNSRIVSGPLQGHVECWLFAKERCMHGRKTYSLIAQLNMQLLLTSVVSRINTCKDYHSDLYYVLDQATRTFS